MAHLMRRYPLAQDANAQVPLAVGLSVRHYSELSDAEHVFYAGDSCLKVALRAPRRAAVKIPTHAKNKTTRSLTRNEKLDVPERRPV
jgi:hypothetical protein